MKMDAVVTSIKSRWSKGNEYVSVSLMDSNNVIAERFASEVELYRPEITEIRAMGLVEGATCTLQIRSIPEVRNGVPVVKATLKNVKTPKAA